MFLPHLVDAFHPSAVVTVRVEAGDPSEDLGGETLRFPNKNEESFHFGIISTVS